MRYFSFAMVISLWLSGCASTPPICKPDNATQAGIAKAMRGEEYSETEGAVCVEEDHTIFRNAFMAGYQEGKSRLCDASQMEQTAFTIGNQGKGEDFSTRSLNICENKSALGKAYKVGHARGLKEFCTPTNAMVAAEREGDQGLAVSPVNEEYKLCSAANRTQIAKSYAAAYERGISRFCEEGRVLRVAVDQARASADPNLPEALKVCFTRSDALRENFVHSFNEERKRVIREQCTFERGRNDGSTDAHNHAQKKTKVPVFCDNATFAVYFSGYTDGWSTAKRGMCSTAAAFNEGYEEGSSGSMDLYSVPWGCDEMHDELKQHYQTGYRQGQLQESLRKNAQDKRNHRPGFPRYQTTD